MSELVGDFSEPFERPSFNYADLSSIFQLKDVNYTRQFAHIYAHRLVQMRQILVEKTQQKWGKRFLRILYANLLKSIIVCIKYDNSGVFYVVH